jgi:hypothetical protein
MKKRRINYNSSSAIGEGRERSAFCALSDDSGTEIVSARRI